jgi:hypothetical protein
VALPENALQLAVLHREVWNAWRQRWNYDLNIVLFRIILFTRGVFSECKKVSLAPYKRGRPVLVGGFKILGNDKRASAFPSWVSFLCCSWLVSLATTMCN